MICISRHRSALVAIFALGLLAASPVRADVHPSGASIEQTAQDDSTSLQHELRIFPRAKVSAADGVAAAERRADGSRVVDISFDGRNDRLIYNVKTLRNGKVWEGRIDAATGSIIGSGLATPLDQFPAEDQRRIMHLVAAKMGLADAISIAETYGGGKAISAGLNDSDGHLTFLVVVVSDGELKAVSIDPSQPPIAAKKQRSLQPVSAR